jgi:hypothetical protein
MIGSTGKRTTFFNRAYRITKSGWIGGCLSSLGKRDDGPQLSYAASWHTGLTVCMQSNNVAVILYTQIESDVSDDRAILSDKNCHCDSSNVLKYLT